MIPPTHKRQCASKRLIHRTGLGLMLGLFAVVSAGCITLLPKTEPTQTYRFRAIRPAEAATPSQAPVLLVRGQTQFAREAAGDRILTLQGREAAYIAGARWLVPASTLFEAALAEAFQQQSVKTRLISTGEPLKGEGILRVGVTTFEARYAEPGSAPMVHLTLSASLISSADRSLLAETLIETSLQADDNRMGSIVSAFEQGVNQGLTSLVKWADANAVLATAAKP